MEGCGFVAKLERAFVLCQAATGSMLAWSALALYYGPFALFSDHCGQCGGCVPPPPRHHNLLLLSAAEVPNRSRLDSLPPSSLAVPVADCGELGRAATLYSSCTTQSSSLFEVPCCRPRRGMSLSLANALQAVAVSWINTQGRPFCALISRREFRTARHDLLFSHFVRPCVVCTSGAAVFWPGVFLCLNWAHIRFACWLLDPFSMALLLITVSDLWLVFGEAAQLRAHKQAGSAEFAARSSADGSHGFLGKYYGSSGVVTGSLLVGLFTGLPTATYIFIKYRRLWHRLLVPRC